MELPNSSVHSPSVEKLKLDIPVMPADLGASIPERYNDNRFVILVRDPRCFFAYWDLTWDRVEGLRKEYGENVWDISALILRVYDLSESSNGQTSAPFFDVEVYDKQAQQHYVHVEKPGHAYLVDFGLRMPDGRFLSLLTSNRIHLPFGRVSDKTDSHWMAASAAELQQWNKAVKMSPADAGADGAMESFGGASSSTRGSSNFARAMALRWEFLKAVFSGSSSTWSHSSAWASKPPAAPSTDEKKS